MDQFIRADSRAGYCTAMECGDLRKTTVTKESTDRIKNTGRAFISGVTA
jgi:hypothetical protein